MASKFRFGQLVECTRFIEGREGTVCGGTRGIVRDVRPQRGQETRYLVAFPKSSSAADGVREYWADEGILQEIPSVFSREQRGAYDDRDQT